MKSLTLFKPTKHIQLGHMYEHMYCDRIVAHMFENGIYTNIDYSLLGTTYHGGMIVIEFAAYSQKAKDQINELPLLRVEITEDTMHNAWNQLESEKQIHLGHDEFSTILTGLGQLDDLNWITYDELDVIDVNDVRRVAKPLYISNKKIKRTKQLRISFYIEKNDIHVHRELLPLANRVLSAIGMNLQYFLTHETGIYFDTETITYDKKSLTYNLIFKCYPAFTITDEELTNSIKYIVSEIQRNGGFERLVNDLKSIAPNKEYWAAPPVQWLYDSSYQVVGAKGWKRIATLQNVQKIIEITHVEAKYGMKKILVF